MRLSAAFLTIWVVLLFCGEEDLVALLLVNGALQITLFALVAVVPFLRTGRMSFVDIAWPFGVALIGVLILVMGEGAAVRTSVVGAVYLFVGLRMGVGAVTMGRATGVIFETEFPRYRYRRLVAEEAGHRPLRLHLAAEMMAQGFANMSVLAVPGLMMAINPAPEVHPLELLGLCLWAVAYVTESVADAQKLRFIAGNEGGVCDVGLWRYSRHPNYFAEWLVWVAVAVAAIPSWWRLEPLVATPFWVALGIAAVGAPVMLYVTLVHLTGAVPAEYFSVRKRADYAAYQARTSRFFPWVPEQRAPGDEA